MNGTQRTSIRKAVRFLRAYGVLCLAAIVVLAPFVWTLYASFVKSDIDLSSFPTSLQAYGFQHYQELLTGSLIPRWWANSIIVTGVILACNLTFNTLAGYALARIRFPGSTILFGVVLVTLMLPPQVLFEPIYTMVIQFGWLNSYQALIVPFLVNPFGVFLMRQFFLGMPQELDDAGRMDGLSTLGVFVRIAVPIAWPAIAAQAIFIFVWNWNTFIFPSVLATSPDMFTLPVGVYQLTHTTFTNHIAESMAGVVLTTLPAIVVFVILQRRFTETLAGGTKG
jgi:multiple sugar transport system permease protein